jgi:hypothetical protein
MKELELLETVLNRFAMATDEQLEPLLATLLVPVLELLLNQNELIKKKVKMFESHSLKF